jgi:probable HAF family extracellular repeat protein
MRDLGTLGGRATGASAINAAGHVVGFAFLTPDPNTGGDRPRAFVWTPEAGMQNLGTLGGCCSSASDINDAGLVVGESETADFRTHAFRWTARGGLRDLGHLGGGHSFAADVNAAGQVVGGSRTAAGPTHAFVWDATSGMRDITRTLASEYQASAINNLGQVVVVKFNDEHPETEPPSGFIWQAGKPLQPITLAPGIVGAVPTDINDRGQVVGVADDDRRVSHAFFWQRDAGMVVVPGPPGDNALALNNVGQVVGQSSNFAALWTVRVHTAAAPVVDRLLAIPLAPGEQPQLAPNGGVWLRVRLTDAGDDGPWDWRLAWGDGVVNTPAQVAQSGEFVFLRRRPYAPGTYTIAVSATDTGGATSARVTTTVTAP